MWINVNLTLRLHSERRASNIITHHQRYKLMHMYLYSVARSMTQSAFQIDSAGYLFFCARWKSYTVARLHPLTLANVARAETALIIMMLLSTPTNRRCPFDSQMIFWVGWSWLHHVRKRCLMRYCFCCLQPPNRCLCVCALWAMEMSCTRGLKGGRGWTYRT